MLKLNIVFSKPSIEPATASHRIHQEAPVQGDCEPPSKDAAAQPKPEQLVAADLIGAAGQVRIEHEGEIYVLRLTRNNKLILTK